MSKALRERWCDAEWAVLNRSCTASNGDFNTNDGFSRFTSATSSHSHGQWTGGTNNGADGDDMAVRVDAGNAGTTTSIGINSVSVSITESTNSAPRLHVILADSTGTHDNQFDLFTFNGYTNQNPVPNSISSGNVTTYNVTSSDLTGSRLVAIYVDDECSAELNFEGGSGFISGPFTTTVSRIVVNGGDVPLVGQSSNHSGHSGLELDCNP